MIHDDWNQNHDDAKLMFPDGIMTSIGKEAKVTAMEGITTFFLSFVKNKRIDLHVDLFPTFHEITAKIAKLYYETKNDKFKANAMEVLQFINHSQKFSCLLDNV